jgi:ABC-type multidrug transport system fused ATPase/permease subunit
MSTDLERIIRGGQMAHEVWATAIEIAIGCWLLEAQIGVAFVTPLAVIAVCSVFMWAVVRQIGKRQLAWMAKIQHRVGLTASAIAQMKQYKMSGMAETIGNMIQDLRDREIAVGKKFRWLSIASIALGAVPTSLSPVITFAVTTSTLDASTIFTSYSYILLVTTPLVAMFQLFPAVLAALACLQRIQNFLSAEQRVDFRTCCPTENDLNHEKEQSASNPNDLASNCAFSIQNGTFGWTSSRPILKDINCEFPRNALSMIVGPVASGKSTLCKVLLGEVPYHSGKVSISLPYHSVAYCEQDPFLYNGTLQDNIVGRSVYDGEKFADILAMTLLDVDVSTLRQGSLTLVGSGGVSLSGGQKQRVSIARALYSGCKTLIFDDVLSGLDMDTESKLFRRVFGPEGFIKRNGLTAILCTHSVRHLPQANHIVLLTDKGLIAGSGSFDELSRSSNEFQRLSVELQVENMTEDDTTTSAPATTSPNSQTASMRQTLRTQLRQTGDWTVYKHWFSSVHPVSTACLFAASLVYGFSNNFSTVWLNYWSQDSFHRTTTFYAGIYALLGVSQLLSMVFSAIATFISMITFAGSLLHKRAIFTVVTATLEFITSTDIGVITNHFSQDLTLIDGELLYAFVNVALHLMQGIGMAFVIATGAPYLAIGYPVLLGALYVIQGFYLRTSRQMRLLDLEAKSPL